ncbi:MAG: hypothetical protein M0C28_14040 [Candidatus Moduliflexus flocculans]|nr:hypothetical protein [Candidatus Moduliflexus flocculans]
MKARLAKGWNTWDTRSVLSHVLLPAGFSISLQLVSRQTGDILNEALPGRSDDGLKERVIPGPHAWDGSYTEVEVEWQGLRIGVRSAAVDKEFFLQVSPLRQAPGDSLVLDPRMLWGRPGQISITGRTIRAETPSGPTELVVAAGQALGTDKDLEVFAGGTHSGHDRSLQDGGGDRGHHRQGRGSMGRPQVPVSRGAGRLRGPANRAGLEHHL